MLNGLVILIITVAMAACSVAPSSPAPSPPEATVVARWVADDGSIVVLNVVVAATARPRLPAFAREYRAASPGARVVIRFFDMTAGDERYVIGHVPADGGPLPVGERPSSAIGIYDFARSSPSATGRAP